MNFLGGVSMNYFSPSMKSNFSQTGYQIFHKTEINILIVFFTTDLCNNYTIRFKTISQIQKKISATLFFADNVIITQSP